MQNLLPVSGGDGSRLFAPPLRFKPVVGEVRYAMRIDNGPFSNVKKLTGTPAQKNGKRYERRVQAALAERVKGFVPGQWFEFRDKIHRRFCQVDGLSQTEELTTIFEIKYSFTTDAWWQLRKLYEPVVRKALVPKALALVVICRNFDPAIQYPESIRLSSPTSLQYLAPNEQTLIDVVPWRL